MAYQNTPAPRLTDGAGSTLPLLAYLAIATVLMVADLRGGFAAQARQHLSMLAEPVWWLAAAPGRLMDGGRDMLSTRASLQAENERLRRELQVNASRLHRLLAVAEENQRLRELLGGTRGYRLNAQLAGIIDVDLDPSRQRIVLDAGSMQGVQVGQAMIDAGGVLGQVIEVTPRHSTALLLTDTEHAIPVQVARSGLRAIAYGTGRTDRLRLPSIPQSGDIRVGDRLVTSGIGGRFPAGFPVGVVEALQPDETQLFVVAEASPAARLDRGVEVLLVSNVIDGVDDGPPLPPPPAPATGEDGASSAVPGETAGAAVDEQREAEGE
ncbi:rod shape-determining protein MreC [Arenimonas caeni]|uniref:Cell shape-determining protein MreC n=1 Tax=Arenimonas caeni TaxID=2058085 RepID=A0A2P6MA37_9GAMM|nr:rod shape-determining protein MreC [Arenimonas caeni]MDY0023155.1 rod shape-determining protein MreC [Arenimonas caeni]PRH82851.1 rod shape-determining protein MreC [Arenimonas caeni]